MGPVHLTKDSERPILPGSVPLSVLLPKQLLKREGIHRVLQEPDPVPVLPVPEAKILPEPVHPEGDLVVGQRLPWDELLPDKCQTA